MSRNSITPPKQPNRWAARWFSERELLPDSFRSVLRFYARTGESDLTALRIKKWVEETIDEFIDDAFDAVEEDVKAEFGYDDIDFQYETKLTLPVELTLGYLYRTAISKCEADINPVTGDTQTPIAEYFRFPFDKKHQRRRKERLRKEAQAEFDFVDHVEDVAQLCTEALLDGDMRDAINDSEYEDFDVGFDTSTEEIAQIAETAQACLESRVERRLQEFPDAVEYHYRTAKEHSQTHQYEDPRFRDLMRAAKEGDETAVGQIKSDYKSASFQDVPDVLTDGDAQLPYSKTQFERVGVIYDGMIEMFRAADIPIEPEFKHAVVLSIIGAQIWLDDIDDFKADLAKDQLTPVTAEYLVQDSEKAAFQEIMKISHLYLDRAIESAVASESLLTGIATEYIYVTGDVSGLPR